MTVEGTRFIPQQFFHPGLAPLGALRDLMQGTPSRQPGEDDTPADGLGPPFDIKETRETFVFVADLPGLNGEELAIDLRPNRLTITGERKPERLADDENYYALERTFGPFCRSFQLPDGIDSNCVSAAIKDGVLTVQLAKARDTLPMRIPVSDGN